MTTKKIRAIGAALLAVIWAGVAVFTWVKPNQAFSDAERRPLETFPQLSADSLLSGDFMEVFERYTLDQFPGRDSLRRVKALFHYNILLQKDNNGIYIEDGYAAQLQYPLNTAGVQKATDRFNYIYDSYLKDTGSTVFFAGIPDKGYYMAEENGYPAMDYDRLFGMVRENLPWATQIDLTDCLQQQDYYRTDTHWRQENLFMVAGKISGAMGVTAPDASDYERQPISRPFYGVYYGQAALPMEPDTMQVLQADYMEKCTTYSVSWDVKTNQPVTQMLYTGVYDWDKLHSKDLYDLYLSGPQPMLVIENPAAATDRELIIFRDSYGSSLTPLLVQNYAKITLVDIRYVSADLLPALMEFKGQDVLLLYSTLILNSGSVLK